MQSIKGEDNRPRGATVVVVGAGLSGLELAAELLKAGVDDIVVLEAGQKNALDHTNSQLDPSESFHFWQTPELDPAFHRPWFSNSPPHYSGVVGLRRGVGGRSLYWRGVTLQIEDWALADPVWPTAIREDLVTGRHGGVGLYDEIERDLSDWIGGPLDAARGPGEEALVGLLSQACSAQSTPVPLARQRWRTESGGERWRAYSPILRWIGAGGRIGGDPPCVLPNCEVTDVHVVNGRVGGVVFRRHGRETNERIDCAVVVLAGAAMENTRLVAQAVAKTSGKRTSFTGLTDHIRQGFVVKIPISKVSTDFAPVGFALIRGNSQTKTNTFIEVETTASPNHLLWDVWSMGEQRRSECNQVWFSATSDAPWEVRVSVGRSPSDDAMVTSQREELQQVWTNLSRAMGIADRALEFESFWRGAKSFGTAYNQAVEAAVAAPITYCCPLGSVDHDGGTTPLGEETNEHGEISEIPGLFVVGPCTFPRAGAANPSLTTLALARRTGRKIVESLLAVA